MVTWHTQSFRELAAPVADVLGARTAKDLEKLRIHTVGDLLRHLPRRYLSGTELTDLTDKLGEPTAWVMGNESWGLPTEHLQLADTTVAVPIYGAAESLNLATAAAVCLYASASAQHTASD